MKIHYIWNCSKCDGVFNSRRELEQHNKNVHPINKIWTCTVCNEVFNSRRLMYNHRKQHSNKVGKSKFAGYHPIINANCKYCNKICKTNSALVFHEKYCKENPNREIYKSHKHTEETKIRLSKSMKLAIKEGRAKGWASSKQNKNGMSYPEIWFEKVINNEFKDKNYEYNKQFFKYKLDFAWVDKKKCIEIDGQQHQTNPIQAQSDKRKDTKLLENGWQVLRISWKEMFNSPKEWIEKAKQFIQS